MSSIVLNEDQILRELMTEAAKWTMKTFPTRMSASGADEIEVRIQMKADADQWVQDNLKLLINEVKNISFIGLPTTSKKKAYRRKTKARSVKR